MELTKEEGTFERPRKNDGPVTPKTSYDGRSYTRNPAKRAWQPHRDYIKNPEFVKACEAAGIPATIRQASKFRNRRGMAFSASKSLQNAA